ncbi:MAG: TolC family protein [Candidatus Coatesbacteria bacterium]|nr:MAG: TolC family protein [Candidatus Coatesbacteria bacterium]
MRRFVIMLALAAVAGAAFAEEITLEEAIDFALARSPAAVAADSTYLNARADLYQGWGGIMPSAQLSYSASRYYDRDVLRFSGYEIPGYVPPAHYYYAQARLDQPLFAGGRLWWGVLSGRASARAGEADRTAQRHQLVVDVARAYFGVLKADGLREVADLSLEASRNNEELALVQYETGALSRAEYLAAVVQRGADEIAAIAAESAAVTARLAFFNTVGMEPEPGLVFAQVEGETPPPDLPPLERLLEEAMAGRPDVVKTREEKRVADLAVRSARAGWFPSVGASATYQWNDYNSPAADTWDDYDEWTLGLSASWYLFDSFQTKANVDRARAAAALRRSAYERLRDVVALDVTNVYYEYKRQAETVTVATETAAAAEEEFAIVQELYALGGASTLELTGAQARFVDAGNSLVEAKYDMLIADFDLHRALGDLPYR